MSGGSMDYFFCKMDEVTDQIPDPEIRTLWRDLTDLLHDIEWYTSGDYGVEDYREAVSDFKAKWFQSSRKEVLNRVLENELQKFKENLILE